MDFDNSLDIPKLFPVRKSRKQKAEFREAARNYLEKLGYSVSVEKGACGAHNLLAGDPEHAKYLVTAHYDTCARMIVPNLITPCSLTLFLLYQFFVSMLIIVPPMLIGGAVGFLIHSYWIGYWIWMVLMFAGIVILMIGPANPSNVNDNTSGVVGVLEIAGSIPENLRKDVCFVLFDLEEAGLIGSASYRKKHKRAVSRQIVLNLDCVGEGDEIYFFPTSKLKKDKKKAARFDAICGRHGKKNVVFRKKGFGIYPSDQANFPLGVGICALKKNRMCLYLSRIHTPRDTILDVTNINILRAAIISMISTDAAE